MWNIIPFVKPKNAPLPAPAERVDMVQEIAEVIAEEYQHVKNGILGHLKEFQFLARLAESPKHRDLVTAAGIVNRGSSTYRDYQKRAAKLPTEEIRGQLEMATSNMIMSHPTWYVVIHEELATRLGRELE